ncbi:MAG: type II toxin-antitoxin system prevent-host-death family antitoxin [Alphaproteobacteria bacterium]|nr:type II toxin-antitoxin system prevent-host-death family antitoxin [Alphaproteobacteria bacterium]MBV9553363.1 type II toxin-antitoxin system prevent-host-death family antitoxin [Alphaproteobacteria bacterium]
MDTISYSKLRQHLKTHMDRVCANHAPLLVMRQNGEHVVLLSLSEYEELDETSYLLRCPANAEHLLRGVADADAGRLTEHDLIE